MKLFKQFCIIFAVVFILAVAITPKAFAAYTRDLNIGSTGSDVAELQSFLESKGYLVMPAGTSKGYFGSLTQAALAKFQAANAISPAAGYFGPITRTKVLSLVEDVVVVEKQESETTETHKKEEIKKTVSRSFYVTDDNDTYESFTADDSGEGDIGHFVINFEVTAGDEDVYVGGAEYEFSNGTTSFSESYSFSGKSKIKQSNGNYKVSAGNTETFTVIVELEADAGLENTPQSMMLTAILWNLDNSDSSYNRYTSRLDRYETQVLFLRGL